MQWNVILALAFALVIAAFAVVNMDSITVNYLFGEASIPLVLVILGATLAGAIIVATFNIANQVANYRKIKRLEKDVASYELKIEQVCMNSDKKENVFEESVLKSQLNEDINEDINDIPFDDKRDKLEDEDVVKVEDEGENYRKKEPIEMEENDKNTNETKDYSFWGRK